MPASKLKRSAQERQVLHRVDRMVRGLESELRHQLECKDQHPLARADELLDLLADFEARGLLRSELELRLTDAGHAALADDALEPALRAA